jgi:hypothetical protein
MNLANGLLLAEFNLGAFIQQNWVWILIAIVAYMMLQDPNSPLTKLLGPILKPLFPFLFPNGPQPQPQPQQQAPAPLHLPPSYIKAVEPSKLTLEFRADSLVIQDPGRGVDMRIDKGSGMYEQAVKSIVPEQKVTEPATSAPASPIKPTT